MVGLAWAGQVDKARRAGRSTRTGYLRAHGTRHGEPPETTEMIKAWRASAGVTPLATAPIIRGPHGRPYKKDNFTHRFRDICRAVGVPNDLQFRDLRRTTATELAAAGTTAAEIAAVTGHSITRSQRILDTYVRADEDIARRAQAKRNNGGSKVCNPPAHQSGKI